LIFSCVVSVSPAALKHSLKALLLLNLMSFKVLWHDAWKQE
jgi:hypothetical protein